MSGQLENILQSGFEELGLSLDQMAPGRYRIYFEYLEEMNKVMNLMVINYF